MHGLDLHYLIPNGPWLAEYIQNKRVILRNDKDLAPLLKTILKVLLIIPNSADAAL